MTVSQEVNLKDWRGAMETGRHQKQINTSAIFIEIVFSFVTKQKKDMLNFSKSLFFSEGSNLSYFNYDSLLKEKKEKFDKSSAIIAGEKWDKNRENMVNGFVTMTWPRKRIYLDSNSNCIDNYIKDKIKPFLIKNLNLDEVKKFFTDSDYNHSLLDLYFFSNTNRDEVFNLSINNDLLSLLAQYKTTINTTVYFTTE